jgi:hypothetical protein
MYQIMGGKRRQTHSKGEENGTKESWNLLTKIQTSL